MKWITREHPKIDRIACPWLIKRFIDEHAEIIFVPFEEINIKAAELEATPFDIPGVEFTHYEDRCTFDYFVKKYNIADPAIHTIAAIVRGADTDRLDIASQSSGLWAISAGLSYNIKDDQKLLEAGMVIYDALYSWAKHLQHQRHTQSPFENMLMGIYHKFLKEKETKKRPAWANQIKHIIQDQLDANLNLNLKEISKDLDVNPSYLSREFSKYFDDLSFGEHIRKLRIERAVQLMSSTNYSLTEIAYLTGFSDQSHFSRVFKTHTGKSPSAFRKGLIKSKADTKS